MNTHDISKMKIELVKSTFKTFTNYHVNQSYGFMPLYPEECEKYSGTNKVCGLYMSTELSRNDPMTYIKLKNYDIWLYEDGFYAKSDKDPFVCFIMYLGGNTFVIYRHVVFGKDTLLYMEYDDATLKVKWNTSLNNATVFSYRTITRDDVNWFKLSFRK